MKFDIDKHIKLNTKVLSLEHGVGQIVGRFDLYDGVNNYIEVAYQRDGRSRYFCLSFVDDIRLLSSQQEIKQALDVLEQKTGGFKPESKNNFQKKKMPMMTKGVSDIVDRIIRLKNRPTRSLAENQLLTSSLRSLAEEIQSVYKIDFGAAKKIVDDRIHIAA